MMGLFRILAALRGLRGTPFDPFGRSRERRAERRMIDDYFADIELVAASLDPQSHALARDLLRWPESVRGFGEIKLAALDEARDRRRALRAALNQPARDRDAA